MGIQCTGGGGWGKFGFETTSTAFPEGTYTYKMVIEAVTINGETATTHKTFSPIDYYNDPKNVNSGEDYPKVFKTPLNIYGFYYGDSTSSGTTYNMVATKRYSDAEQVKLQASESNPIDFAGVRSLFAMHGDAPAKGSEFKVQLMELYYKPADVTIKFANGGVSGTTLPESVTVNSFDAVDTTLYRATNTADKLFKGWVDEDGNRVTNKYYPTKDVTLTAVWEDAWSDEFGYLVAAYDFDNIAAGTNVKDSTGKLSANVYGAQPSAEVLTAIHKDFPTEMFIYAASANTHTINYDGNNGFINLNAVKSDQKWGRTHLVSNGVFPAGTYNLVKDVKLAEHDDTVTRISAGDANIYLVNPYASTHPAEAYKNHSPGNTVLSSNDGWDTIRSNVVFTEGQTFTKTVKVNGVPETITYEFQGFTSFQSMPTVFSDAASFECNIQLDNFKLYYMPKATVTFEDPAGYAKKLPESVSVEGATALNLKDIYCTTDTENVSFVGWAYEPNGKVATSAIKVMKDVTLYAVWATAEAHEQYGELVFNLDFENADVLSSSTKYMTNYGYVKNNEGYREWNLGSGDINNYAIYGINKNNEPVYKNGVKQEGYSDYEVVNNVLGFTPVANKANPQITVNANSSGQFAEPGYFTVLSDSYVNVGSTDGKAPGQYLYQLRPHVYGEKEDGSPLYFDHATLSGDHLNDIKAHKELNTWGEKITATKSTAFEEIYNRYPNFSAAWNSVGSGEYEIKNVGGIMRILFYYSYGSNAHATEEEAQKDLFLFDNLKLYWKPLKANLTIDINGNDAAAKFGVIEMDTANVVDISYIYEDYTSDKWGGKAFKGLAFDAAGTQMITEDFYITGDTTVYAIWSDTDYEGTRPATSTLNSIRTDEYNGIRFMASVHNSQRAIAEEYGFIVTRSKLLGNKALDFNLAEGTYVSGAAYEKNGDADYIYEATEDFTIFTAVFVGMPEKAEFYEKEIVARPYIKYSNGTVVYGKTHKRCVLSVAESIRDNGYTDVNGNPMDEVSKAKIQKVLTTCGKSL